MELYITGAGVSSDSGIPTFRGSDGFWTIGSKNYTPQEMATRTMYKNNPGQFLLWYYKRFIKYRNAKPNKVHEYLIDKYLITQNIDGLDFKAGNKNYIAIHGNLHKITLYHDQNDVVEVQNAPWDHIEKECPDINDNTKLKSILLDAFKVYRKRIQEAESNNGRWFNVTYQWGGGDSLDRERIRDIILEQPQFTWSF